MEVNKKNFSYDAPQVEVMELYVESAILSASDNEQVGEGDEF